jgi:hypothetical protein
MATYRVPSWTAARLEGRVRRSTSGARIGELAPHDAQALRAGWQQRSETWLRVCLGSREVCVGGKSKRDK